MIDIIILEPDLKKNFLENHHGLFEGKKIRI